ncbi:protein of unknown function [Candidatus Filomicrobium marinum]|uniref:Uncharacterized protein n=1 Tax=Candidatus Filomicrobium marinum TaxID=1608628 RepID=A0A0D6JE84_9HYPH|nr:protein of unknown function [Candidatus Filomicrobium marinum]CPR18576.1 protein of unknown function [Candidatus Filomicrobium marinum]
MSCVAEMAIPAKFGFCDPLKESDFKALPFAALLKQLEVENPDENRYGDMVPGPTSVALGCVCAVALPEFGSAGFIRRDSGAGTTRCSRT